MASASPEPSSRMEIPDGIIIPPPDIRDVLEITVGYVFRNGMAFEEKMRAREQQNTKFSFLDPADPYHNFYQWRLDEYRAGRGGQNSGPGSDSKPVTNGDSARGKGGISAPEPFEFSIKLPPISAQDLEIIKLTALYVAHNGKPFLTSISHRESRNFQFDFLRPNHSFFPLFSKLIDQYKKVINPPQNVLDKLDLGIKDKYTVLERSKARAEWTAQEEERSKKALETAEAERISYAQIDWHDFVVVETIEFTDHDKKAQLPPPTTLAELQYASLEQKKLGIFRIEEAPPDFVPEPPAVTEPHRQRNIQPVSSQTASLPSSLPLKPQSPVEGKSEQSRLEDERINDRRELAERQKQTRAEAQAVPSNIKIRPAGSTRLSKKKSSVEDALVKSPFTGEMIPQADYDNHVRIMLLDPKWKEQKDLADARQASSILNIADVTSNMKRFASAREDLFDNENNSENQDTLKRKAPEVQWDGYTKSKHLARAQANANVDPEEERREKQRRIQRENAIGPGARPR